MIRQRSKFSFSEFFYAIDFSAMKFGKDDGDGYYWATVPAIWFKRKNGATAVCSGTLRAYSTPANPITSPADFMQHHDGRYGGGTEYKWDGIEMWGSDNNFYDLVEANKMLDPLLEAFEDDQSIPAGYDGWFAINK